MVIADTGFWLAIANRKDRHHKRATRRLAELHEPIVTTLPVMSETCYLLLTRLGNTAQRRFVLSYASGAFDVFDLKQEHATRIERHMRKYADLPMDLADASLLILAEHLGHGRILTTDTRDFNAYRWKERKPFQNLLADGGDPA